MANYLLRVIIRLEMVFTLQFVYVKGEYLAFPRVSVLTHEPFENGKSSKDLVGNQTNIHFIVTLCGEVQGMKGTHHLCMPFLVLHLLLGHQILSSLRGFLRTVGAQDERENLGQLVQLQRKWLSIPKSTCLVGKPQV